MGLLFVFLLFREKEKNLKNNRCYVVKKLSVLLLLTAAFLQSAGNKIDLSSDICNCGSKFGKNRMQSLRDLKKNRQEEADSTAALRLSKMGTVLLERLEREDGVSPLRSLSPRTIGRTYRDVPSLFSPIAK